MVTGTGRGAKGRNRDKRPGEPSEMPWQRSSAAAVLPDISGDSGCGKDDKPMTRYEKLTKMPVEDMARLLTNICAGMEGCGYCPFYGDCPCMTGPQAWTEWLEGEGQKS